MFLLWNALADYVLDRGIEILRPRQHDEVGREVARGVGDRAGVRASAELDGRESHEGSG